MLRLFLLRTLTAGILCGLIFSLMLLGLSLAGGSSKREAFRWPSEGFKQAIVNRYRAGEHSGREFAKRWGLAVLYGCFAAAAASAALLSFGGFLPWCREKADD